MAESLADMEKIEGVESKVDERRFSLFSQKHIFTFEYVDTLFRFLHGLQNAGYFFRLNSGVKTVLAGCGVKEKLGLVRVLLHVSE
jgi:hypothetical protein